MKNNKNNLSYTGSLNLSYVQFSLKGSTNHLWLQQVFLSATSGLQVFSRPLLAHPLDSPESKNTQVLFYQ